MIGQNKVFINPKVQQSDKTANKTKDSTPRMKFLLGNEYISNDRENKTVYFNGTAQRRLLPKSVMVQYQPKLINADYLYESAGKVNDTEVYLVNPFAIKFSQSTAGFSFSKPGENEAYPKDLNGKNITTVWAAADDLFQYVECKKLKTMPAIKVFVNPGYAICQTDEKGRSLIKTTAKREPALYTLDNRRLVAARLAGVNVPVIFVPLTAAVKGAELFKLTGRDGNHIRILYGSGKSSQIADEYYDVEARELSNSHERIHQALLNGLQSKKLLPQTSFNLLKKPDSIDGTFNLNQKMPLPKSVKAYRSPDYMDDNKKDDNKKLEKYSVPNRMNSSSSVLNAIPVNSFTNTTNTKISAQFWQKSIVENSEEKSKQEPSDSSKHSEESIVKTGNEKSKPRSRLAELLEGSGSLKKTGGKSNVQPQLNGCFSSKAQDSSCKSKK